MVRQFNPYCVFPFYQAHLSEADRDCPLYSPTKVLPMFQVELNGSVSGDVEVTLEDYYTGATNQELTGIEIVNTEEGKGYITYTGAALTTEADEGLYRVRITGGNIVSDLVSHVVCLSKVYNAQDWQPEVSCVSGSGDWEFTVTFDEHPGLPTEIEVNYGTGNGWERIGDGLNEEDAVFVSSEAPFNNVRLRLKVYLHDALFYRESLYEFTPTDPDPCATATTTEVATGGQGYERFMCLAWQNTNDLQPLGLQYSNVVGSDGFLQQFYFEGYASQAGTATEENFLSNGFNEKVLDSLSIARLYNIEFYPLPDACIAPMKAANSHNVRQLSQTADGWNAALTAIALAPEAPERADCSKGLLSVEMNRALVGCQDNATEIV